MFRFIKNRIENLEKEKAELLQMLENANKKLIEYMDITRKEALESYRKGLQDGINIQLRHEAPAATYNPVKSVEEYKQEAQQVKELNKDDRKFMQSLVNLLSYDGTKQEEIEE